MPYRLREDLSYCHVDGHLIFLDLAEDRYFRLPDRLERLFLAYLHSDAQPSFDVNDLVRKNILAPAPNVEGPVQASLIAAPSRSALEHKSAPSSGLAARTLLEVFATVCSTQLQLKTRRLKRVVNALVEQRQRRTAGASPTSDEAFLLEAADTFRRARPYVPIETCCLLDSLSMLKFLARRRLPARLVFGVTRAPFGAHCWVQAGDWVLNDTVGNVMAHTPIREV